MKNKFTLGARLSLVLSLAISSSLVANVAQAGARQDQQANEEIIRTITKLVDLGADQQWLVAAALHRATTSNIQPSQRNISVVQGAIRSNVEVSVPQDQLLPITSQQPDNSRRRPHSQRR